LEEDTGDELEASAMLVVIFLNALLSFAIETN
jgi:hypothetical protein